jgi:hypothetical protein
MNTSLETSHPTAGRTPASPQDPGPFVCGRCIDDDDLKAFIEAEAISKECTFCGRRARRLIAAYADLTERTSLKPLP